MNIRKIVFSFGVVALFLGCSGSAFAGQWAATGRALSIYSESIEPYLVSYANNCAGGAAGPSGGYTYGDDDGKNFGACATDTATGWRANFNATHGSGQCRPNPSNVGGGYSCEDRAYAITGHFYTGQLPTACSTIGTYAVKYSRTDTLIYYGSGTIPTDFYDEVNEWFTEYKCQ